MSLSIIGPRKGTGTFICTARRGLPLFAVRAALAASILLILIASSGATAWATPAQVLIIRHGEKPDSGLRPLETVTPLAQALGLTVLDPYLKDDTDSLATAILSNSAYEGKMVLICWEYKAITEVASSLGVNDPGSYPKHDFGQVWEIDFSGDQVSDFKQYEEDVNLPSLLPALR